MVRQASAEVREVSFRRLSSKEGRNSTPLSDIGIVAFGDGGAYAVGAASQNLRKRLYNGGPRPTVSIHRSRPYHEPSTRCPFEYLPEEGVDSFARKSSELFTRAGAGFPLSYRRCFSFWNVVVSMHKLADSFHPPRVTNAVSGMPIAAPLSPQMVVISTSSAGSSPGCLLRGINQPGRIETSTSEVPVDGLPQR